MREETCDHLGHLLERGLDLGIDQIGGGEESSGKFGGEECCLVEDDG